MGLSIPECPKQLTSTMTEVAIPSNEPPNEPIKSSDITAPTESTTISVEPVEVQLTILRIKRKRNEEPLDALLVEQQQQQVNNKPHKDKKSRRDSVTAANDQQASAAFPKLFRLAETVEEGSFRDATKARQLSDRIRTKIHQNAKEHRLPVKEVRTKEKNRKDRLDKSVESSKEARYRVQRQNREAAGLTDKLLPSEADLELFQVYDAVKDDAIEPKIIPDVEDPDDKDEIMCNFIPMVREYLTLNEKREVQPESSSDDDYVYDIYYRDDKAGAHDAVLHQNVGSLLWFDQNVELMNDDSEVDSEADNDDEDSNAEDFYGNDYPDEDEGGDWDNEEHDLSSDEYDDDFLY